MKYKYGNTRQYTKVKAQVVGEELEKLVKRNRGKLTPETVLQSAKLKRSRLNPCFEWRDNKAAHKYRIEQAKYLLRAVVVEIESADPEDYGMVQVVRAFPNIEAEDGSYYTTHARVFSDDEVAEQLEAQIVRELQYLRCKHKGFKRFRDVWKAIDNM